MYIFDNNYQYLNCQLSEDDKNIIKVKNIPHADILSNTSIFNNSRWNVNRRFLWCKVISVHSKTWNGKYALNMVYMHHSTSPIIYIHKYKNNMAFIVPKGPTCFCFTEIIYGLIDEYTFPITISLSIKICCLVKKVNFIRLSNCSTFLYPILIFFLFW